jgi:hypothetical protein
MARKVTPKPPEKNEGAIIYGDVHATTFIGRDQVNYNNQQQLNINTPAEFVAELRRLQTEIQSLKAQLEPDDALQVDVVVQRVETAIVEAEQPQPVGERIRTALEKAQKNMALLDGTLQSAMSLGATLATLGALALKVFGL